MEVEGCHRGARRHASLCNNDFRCTEVEWKNEVRELHLHSQVLRVEAANLRQAIRSTLRRRISTY